MSHPRLFLAVAALPLLALAGCGSDSTSSAAPTTQPTAVVQTSFPDLTAPSGDPELPALATSAPTGGRVGRIAGPFDDRFRLIALNFDGRAVSGRLGVTSDVSDILELQVLAGFYDRSGKLLGQGRYTYHLNEDTHHDAGTPDEHRTFRIAVPASLRAQVHSAAVGVPVLVNE